MNGNGGIGTPGPCGGADEENQQYDATDADKIQGLKHWRKIAVIGG